MFHIRKLSSLTVKKAEKFFTPDDANVLLRVAAYYLRAFTLFRLHKDCKIRLDHGTQ